MRCNWMMGALLVALGGLLASPLMAQDLNLGVGNQQPLFSNARVPSGIYTNFLLDATVKQARLAAYYPTLLKNLPAYPNPAVAHDPTDTVLVRYFTTLLDDPAISGLAPQIPWDLLNPNDPGPDANHPAAGAYLWNSFDDAFIAVDQWNKTHPWLPAKTIQLIVSPGYNSPTWIFSNIDASVCGKGSAASCTGSCDGLFMTPAPAVSSQCGYTTLFFQVESGTPAQIPFPLPWNSVYKSDWATFLTALNHRVQQEPSSGAFVSIAMGGPTASSTEMILPNDTSQRISPYPPSTGAPGSSNVAGGKTILALLGTLPAGETPASVDVPTAWNTLFQNFYGSDPKFQNSDLPFIQEFDAMIDLYGRTFSGTTLALTTTTDALPAFPVAASSPLLLPAPGFESDCGNSDSPITDPSDAMACAAVTEVLVHYTNPTVGGNNAKLVFEAGMTAARDGVDLGTNGIKWLAATTAAGRAPLPGAGYDMARILGGVQFAHTFSNPANVQAEGCPGYTPKTPDACPALTPGEGYENVVQLSYFPGTLVAPIFGAPSSVNFANFRYSSAPMNFLEIYDGDVLYALGLSNCNMVNITGSPASDMPPDVSTCAAITSDTRTTQEELDLTGLGLFFAGESAGSR